MLGILTAIIGRAHWVYSVSEVVFEFVKIQFTEAHPKLGKIRKSCWIMYSKDRFSQRVNFGQQLGKCSNRRSKSNFWIKLIPF